MKKDLITVDDAEKLLEETCPAFKVAKERAEGLAKTFQFNEVIKMLDALIAEVNSMHIAERFSADKKILRSVYTEESLRASGINPALWGMTERDHKKWQLVHDLVELRARVVGLSGMFKDIVIDIEGTKID